MVSGVYLIPHARLRLTSPLERTALVAELRLAIAPDIAVRYFWVGGAETTMVGQVDHCTFRFGYVDYVIYDYRQEGNEPQRHWNIPLAYGTIRPAAQGGVTVDVRITLRPWEWAIFILINLGLLLLSLRDAFDPVHHSFDLPGFATGLFIFMLFFYTITLLHFNKVARAMTAFLRRVTDAEGGRPRGLG